jgi:heme/copper-type cytochrome/quinol oxidase subunit 2
MVDDILMNSYKLFLLKNRFFKNVLNIKNNLESTNLYNHDSYTETTRWSKRSQGSVNPIRIIRYPLTNESIINDLTGNYLFRFRYNEEHSKLIGKPFSHNNYLVLKQKKYKPLKLVSPRTRYFRNKITGDYTKIIRYSGKMLLMRNSIFIEDPVNQTLQYKFFKKMKKHSENIPITLWKRLLRTKRTLVLPAHVNISIITNSFDVVHSWFVPGLGLKMDCIPGRATHHVLHIDNVGFYYGQCAEICGRYHHHMPIRVCALPFEHFLVWWHSYGLPKLLFMGTDQKRLTKGYALRKYIW